MADLSVLVDLVKVDAPEVPKALIRSSLIRIARDFCEETRASTYKSLAYLSAGNNLADIDYPKHYEVVEVTRLTKSGRPVGLLSEPASNPQGEPAAAAVVTDDGYALEFDGFPKASTEYVVYMDCKPALDASKVDDFLVSQWGEQIAYGAIGYLLMQVGKPWSNPDYGQVFTAKYQQGVSSARRSKHKGLAQSKPTVKFRKWV